VVYAAADPELGRHVALKLVSPEHSTPERRANAAAHGYTARISA
jgi:hypothetical protein